MLNLRVPQSNISADPLQGVGESSPDVSIIIVSWNVRELLLQCLYALTQQSVTGTLKTEVIVIDNASHDASADAAARFSGVTVVRSAANLGYGSANNIGLQLAQGKHLLILNPDTVPQDSSIETLVNFQRSRRSAGIVSPRLLNADGSVQTSAFRFPTLLMAAIDLFPLPVFIPGRIRQKIASSRLNGRYPEEGKTVTPFRINHPLGACMLLSREAYASMGGFDPTIFMYSEEIDLAMRYASAGWECWQVPEAKVIHLGGQSTGQLPDKMLVELWRSRILLYHKHYSRLSLVALISLLLLRQVWTLVTLLIGLASGRVARDSAKSKLRQVRSIIKLVFRR